MGQTVRKRTLWGDRKAPKTKLLLFNLRLTPLGFLSKGKT